MPGYKGHLTGGIAAFGLTCTALIATKMITLLSPIAFIGWFLSTLAGSLFPDIDVKSKGQKYFYWLIFILLLYLTYQKQFMPLAILAVVSTAPMLVKHRGIFHNVWFLCAGFSFLSYRLMLCIPKYEQMIVLHTLFFLAGVISHLWLDLGLIRMLRIR